MSPSDSNPQMRSEPNYVVGVGASAGGLEALEKLFANMPTDTGMAFIVVQHLSPDFKSVMDELLSRHTNLVIKRVEDGMQIESNTIFLLQPKNNVSIEGSTLRLTAHDPVGGFNLPIDIFFSSLARDAKEKAIAVVLSGTGSDGSRGILEISENGGLVVSQDTHSAAFDGMPRSAIATEKVDLICRPESIGSKLVEFAQSPDDFERGQIEPEAEAEGELQKIFRMFRKMYSLDFSLYKPATIHRRIERRMQLARARHISDYLVLLENNSEELELLYRDLLVEVTYFFRDVAAFEKLRQEVIPKLLQNATSDEDLRIWVAGCATGEEAYTIAMLVAREMENSGRENGVKIFASDVHQASLDFASNGVYTHKAVESVPIEFLEKYFLPHGDDFLVKQELRRMVVFVKHDLTSDPPFTKLDLLSCRNVLIYLDAEIQKRIFASFHFGLKVGGTLFLGPSESVNPIKNEFRTVDQHWRIFTKKRDVRLPETARMPIGPPTTLINGDRERFTKAGVSRTEDSWLLPSAYEDLLARFVPASLLVNEFYELVHTFGDARKLLNHPSGRTTLDVSRMLNGDLRSAVTAALHRVSQNGEALTFKNITADTPVGLKTVDVHVEPFFKGTRKLFLICFSDEKKTTDPSEASVDQDFSNEKLTRIDDLEQELNHTRQSLQTTVEELETSNEELQSTNEELIASNEELQSTNEELHSVNEELYTVNSEYQRKIEELTDLTNDLNNLLTSTDIGTVFLDNQLRIRKFTPAISSAFHILEHDIGRPIDHISYNFEDFELMTQLRKTLANGTPFEKEVRSRKGNTYLKRIQPYFDESGEKDGLVLTFDDISVIKEANEERKHAEEELAITQKELQEFAYAVSHDLQAPLRHIQESANRLQDQLGENAIDDDILPNILKSSDRMNAQIDALLTYSRVNTRGDAFQPTDLDQVLENALKTKKYEIESSNASITHESLPTVDGDLKQLTTCFEHLIDNSIKYCNETPKIHFGIEARDNRWLISIHDNGIGIERRHNERAFVIFQRLGFKEGIEGIGLGLPLCRRIIERHDGWIWVESTPGKGSTFFIDLPRVRVDAIDANAGSDHARID